MGEERKGGEGPPPCVGMGPRIVMLMRPCQSPSFPFHRYTVDRYMLQT